ncbi:MAG: hypothetical protein HY319_09750 [Armatimonadetes bacterium]|nr:hypothetical protein [Armatimonadota bacterium]
MITELRALSPLQSTASRVGQLRRGSSEEPELGPVDQADVSRPPTFSGRALARMGTCAALAVAAMGALAPMSAAAHDYGFPAPRQSQSIGVTIDSHRGAGVVFGSRSYDPYSGTYRRESVRIDQRGVSVHQESGWGYRGPHYPRTLPYPHGGHYPVQTMPLPVPPRPCGPVIGWPGPVIVSPAPVIVSPPPVIYSPPTVIVVPGY